MLTINNTLDGYLRNVEIKGNTIQGEDLADIRSVGDKVEGQELYEIPLLCTGKNLFDGKLEKGDINFSTGVNLDSNLDTRIRSVNHIYVKSGTSYYIQKPSVSLNVSYYDQSKNFISSENTGTNKFTFTTPSNCRYIRFICVTTDLNYKFQLEEGTQATSYEPYVEDKLTILSPTQLEKVGTVADRIVEKDGVWGVEKCNITVFAKDYNITSAGTSLGGLKGYSIKYASGSNTLKSICNKLKLATWSSTEEGYYVQYNEVVVVCNIQTLDEFKEYAKDLYFKINLVSNEFIPLPHSQQVILRTFANKTNISSLCEIEPVIKGDVAKSLGGVVNVHTEQIDNIHAELERVKKLESSTVSTVKNEGKDFVTVEATNRGYFEDVVVSGRTEVNYCTSPTNYKLYDDNLTQRIFKIQTSKTLEPNKEYVFVFDFSDTVPISGKKIWFRTARADNQIALEIKNGIQIVKTSIGSDLSLFDLRLQLTDITSGVRAIVNSVMVFDVSDNSIPTQYFQGLASVGDGTDEIVVSSVNENLFDGELETGGLSAVTGVNINSEGIRSKDYIYLGVGSYVVIANNNKDLRVDAYLYDNSKTFIKRLTFANQGIVLDKSYFVKLFDNASINDINTTIMLNKGTTPKPYVEHKTDKKRLLFYNPTTEAWEKPILCEWDTIEKHSDGKYYYHVRSEKVAYVAGDESKTDRITDMTTTVKKLATEIVYECTNLDLITYADTTHLVVKSGVLVPNITLKYHGSISNVVNLLQKKVSLLENNMTSYIITQNRLALTARYNADNATFKIDYNTMQSDSRTSKEVDEDLFTLLQHNIMVGKDNYDYDKMLEMLDFYAFGGFITWEMWDELWLMVEVQHNPLVEEDETPEI